LASPASPPIVCLVADLLFSTRIADAIRQQGGEPVVVSTAAELRQAVERWPVLILIDIQALPAEQWRPEVRRAKASPQSKNIPIYGFGSHVQADALKAARAAGCDHAWPRSRFVEQLPQVIAQAIDPPATFLEGWDAPPSPAFLHGVALFNAGEFYKQHDVFEAIWREDPRSIRELYQGILQIGVAFHHIEQGNYRGAVKMLRRGLPRLRSLPPVCQSLDVATLRSQARAVHDTVVALGPDRLGEFDSDELREIRLRLVDR
jgi:hypothetical protein